MANSGEMLSSSAANAPAVSPNRNAVRRNRSQVVATNINMNGARTTRTASEPVSFMAAQAIQNESGG